LLGYNLSGDVPSDADTIADQSEINSIQSQLSTDQATQATDAANDSAAVSAARHAIISGSKQQATLFADQAAGNTLIGDDQRAIFVVAQANISPVIADQGAILAAQLQGYSSSESRAEFNLNKDEAVLVGIVGGAVNKMLSDQAAVNAKVARDHARIKALLQSTSSYTDAVAKQQSDATTDSNAVQTDQAILAAAQSKLATDKKT